MISTQKNGFTLIELMVVITILGLMATAVLASLSNAREKGRDARRLTEIKQLQSALEIYRNSNNGNYPCATANPGCAPTGAAAEVRINDGIADNVLTAITSLYRPQSDIGVFAAGTVYYRVRSTAGASDDSPDRGSYTILARFETNRRNLQGINMPAGTWCKINVGTGHSSWNANPNCF